jgi:putative transposase
MRGSKKNLASETPREARIAMLEWENPTLPLTTQAELLSLSRASLYYKPVPPSPEEVRLKHRIDELYTLYPFMGSRRITAMLHEEGESIHRNTVQKYMREMGLVAIYPGPNLSKRNLQHRTYPYLLRGLTIAHPNHVWGIDITYIRMKHGWMYLVAILDWFSRYVIDWQLDQSLEIDFVIETVKRALAVNKPQILNSDQGSHFTSSQYTDLLKEAEVRISMDGKGRATDNIFTERFWRSLKYEEVYLQDYSTPRETRQGVNRYIEFYNHYRPHQSLGYKTPASIYKGKLSTSG